MNNSFSTPDRPIHLRTSESNRQYNTLSKAKETAEKEHTFQPFLAKDDFVQTFGNGRYTSPNDRAVKMSRMKEEALSLRNIAGSASKGSAQKCEELFQSAEQKRVQTAIERQHRAEQEQQELRRSFKPEIPKESDEIAKQRLNNNQVGIFDRLRSGDSKKFMEQVLANVKKDLELKDCTFQPTINSDSKAMSERKLTRAETPIHERLFHEAESNKQKAEVEKEQQYM